MGGSNQLLYVAPNHEQDPQNSTSASRFGSAACFYIIHLLVQPLMSKSTRAVHLNVHSPLLLVQTKGSHPGAQIASNTVSVIFPTCALWYLTLHLFLKASDYYTDTIHLEWQYACKGAAQGESFHAQVKNKPNQNLPACRNNYEGENDTLGLVVAHAERRMVSNLATCTRFLGRESNSHSHAHMRCL